MTQQRAVLGIDGNCGFALLGENIQEGESEFEEIVTDEPTWSSGYATVARYAINRAYQRLKTRLGLEHLSYVLDSSHPNAC